MRVSSPPRVNFSFHLQVTVLDIALNLRRRWRRLGTQLPEHEIAAMVHAFWPVSAFDEA